MLEPSRTLDPLGWLKWLWKSSIGTGLLLLVVAGISRDFFFALAAVGVIIGGLAEYVGRRNCWLWWVLLGVGTIFVAGGLYLSIENYRLWDILKP